MSEINTIEMAEARPRSGNFLNLNKKNKLVFRNHDQREATKQYEINLENIHIYCHRQKS